MSKTKLSVLYDKLIRNGTYIYKQTLKSFVNTPNADKNRISLFGKLFLSQQE